MSILFQLASLPKLRQHSYFTVTVMTGVGLGDLYPITTLGRILAMLMMLLGTAVFVCFTAVLAVSILEVEIDHRDDKT